MAASYRTAGAVAYSASGGTSVAPSYPTGIVAGDVLLLVVGQKPSTANGGTVTTPSGWTLVGSITGAGGYGTTLGADTGNTNLFVYSKIAAGSETGSITVTVGTNNVCWARIKVFQGNTGAWNLAFATGSDTSAGALSAATGTINLAPGDSVAAFVCIPTDVSTPSQFSAPVFSASGITFANVTERAEPDSTTGNDIGGLIVTGDVSAGSETVAMTVSATTGGTTTNVRGPVMVVRVREAPGAPQTATTESAIATAVGESATATLADPPLLADAGVAVADAVALGPTLFSSSQIVVTAAEATAVALGATGTAGGVTVTVDAAAATTGSFTVTAVLTGGEPGTLTVTVMQGDRVIAVRVIPGTSLTTTLQTFTYALTDGERMGIGDVDVTPLDVLLAWEPGSGSTVEVDEVALSIYPPRPVYPAQTATCGVAAADATGVVPDAAIIGGGQVALPPVIVVNAVAPDAVSGAVRAPSLGPTQGGAITTVWDGTNWCSRLNIVVDDADDRILVRVGTNGSAVASTWFDGSTVTAFVQASDNNYTAMLVYDLPAPAAGTYLFEVRHQFTTTNSVVVANGVRGVDAVTPRRASVTGGVTNSTTASVNATSRRMDLVVDAKCASDPVYPTSQGVEFVGGWGDSGRQFGFGHKIATGTSTNMQWTLAVSDWSNHVAFAYVAVSTQVATCGVATGSVSVASPPITLGAVTYSVPVAIADAIGSDASAFVGSPGAVANADVAISSTVASSPSFVVGGRTATSGVAISNVTGHTPSISVGGVSASSGVSVATGAANNASAASGGVIATSTTATASVVVSTPSFLAGGVSAITQTATASVVSNSPTIVLGGRTATGTTAFATSFSNQPVISSGTYAAQPSVATATGTSSTPTITVGARTATSEVSVANAAGIGPSIVLGGLTASLGFASASSLGFSPTYSSTYTQTVGYAIGTSTGLNVVGTPGGRTATADTASASVAAVFGSWFAVKLVTLPSAVASVGTFDASVVYAGTGLIVATIHWKSRVTSGITWASSVVGTGSAALRFNAGIDTKAQLNAGLNINSQLNAGIAANARFNADINYLSKD